ncbi:MAG TPA: hypothetical protein VMP67_05205 [Candidatus Limnocylindria bacterium]|nr:hypothetical protein [Candidatus Limnocylindria bacterium]
MRDHFACELRGETQLRGLGGLPTYFVVGPVAAAIPPVARSAAPA